MDASKLESFREVAQLEYRLSQRYSEYLAAKLSGGSADQDVESFFTPLEDEKELFTFPFAEWLQTHQDQDDLDVSSSNEAAASSMPSDHPKIPGVDFSDPEAIKSCPFLSSKKDEETSAAPASRPPSDHPSIPGVDFSDPEAMKACPFLSAKKTEPATAPVAEVPKSNGSMPSDHPSIPGVDFSDPEAVKACPFLSAKSRE